MSGALAAVDAFKGEGAEEFVERFIRNSGGKMYMQYLVLAFIACTCVVQ